LLFDLFFPDFLFDGRLIKGSVFEYN